MGEGSDVSRKPRGWLGSLVLVLFAIATAGAALTTAAQEAEPPPAEEEATGSGWRSRVKSMLTREPGEEGEEEESEEGEARGGGDLLITSMDDPGQEFVIVDPTPAFYFNEWGGGRTAPGGGLRDPVTVAIDRGLVSIESETKEKGGNAILGLRIIVVNPVDGEEGRVILYGTMVRLIEPEPAGGQP